MKNVCPYGGCISILFIKFPTEFKDSDLLADKSGVEDMADAIFKEQWIDENRTDEQIAEEIVAGWFRECLRN